MVDEGIDIALGVGNILQGRAGGPEPRVLRDVVFEGRPRVSPVYPWPVGLGQICNRRVRIFDHPLLETLQSFLAQSRRQRTDEIFVLAVGVLGQLFECPVGQPARIAAGCAGNGAQIVGLEGAGDCFVAVPAAVQDRVRQSHECHIRSSALYQRPWFRTHGPIFVFR